MSSVRPRRLLRLAVTLTAGCALLPATALANGSGGSGIPTATPKKHKVVRRKRKRTTRTTVVVRSQHLGQRTLRQGMKGHDVRVLQGYLTLAGFSTGVDGDFGPGTKANVIAFEQANDLRANGVVTFADQLVLRQVVAQAETAGSVGKATINSNGTATAPAGAPAIVQRVIAAANQIIDKPYKYGGGHASFTASGYDCSGAVSYALHGGGLLSSPEDSSQLESYGSTGIGKWLTVYADSGHAFLVVAGIAFDTANYGGPNIPSGSGPRWRSNPTGNLADGGDYVIRHVSGL